MKTSLLIEEDDKAIQYCKCCLDMFGKVYLTLENNKKISLCKKRRTDPRYV